MRALLITASCAALLAMQPAAAQTTTTAGSKPPARKAAAPKTAKPKLAHSAQKAVEEVTPIDDDPSLNLTEAELGIAKQVQTGDMPCELGANVRVIPARRPGVFVIVTKGYRFLMHPVESRTGAIRLEDPKRGAMWLQLGNKSMLMSQKLGQRLADECQSPRQKDVAEDLRLHPRPSILEPMPQGGMQGGMPCCGPQSPASKPQEALPPATPASAAGSGALPPAPPMVPASAPTVPASAAAPAASAATQ